MSTTRLNATEEAAWRGFNEMRAQLIPRISRELAADSGLTEADFAVLLALVEAPSRQQRSSDLLRHLNWEASRFSHQIARMEARATISRARCADDGRNFMVSITDSGLDSMRRATPGHTLAVRHWFVDALTNEQLAALAEIAAAVAAHVERVDAEGPATS